MFNALGLNRSGSMSNPLNPPTTRWFVLCPVLFSTVISTAARADQVMIREVWIPNAQVQGVISGHLIYTIAGRAKIEQPLSKVQGIKLDAHPELGQAEDAIRDQKPAEAISRLEHVRRQSRQPWLREWITARLMWVANQHGRTEVAIKAYVDLIQMDTELFYLQQPPRESIARAGDDERKQIVDRLSGVARQARGKVRKQIDEILAMVKAIPSPAEFAADRPADAVRHETSKAPPEHSKVVLTRAIDNGDPITQLLRRGAFEKALEAAHQELKHARKLAMRLYQQGTAQLNLGEKRDDPELYKDAGLSFMRVVVHFPSSRYAGPALLEAGRVHQKIGRLDLAASLYNRAGLAFDAQEEPELAVRLDVLLKSLQK